MHELKYTKEIKEETLKGTTYVQGGVLSSTRVTPIQSCAKTWSCTREILTNSQTTSRGPGWETITKDWNLFKKKGRKLTMNSQKWGTVGSGLETLTSGHQEVVPRGIGRFTLKTEARAPISSASSGHLAAWSGGAGASWLRLLGQGLSLSLDDFSLSSFSRNTLHRSGLGNGEKNAWVLCALGSERVSPSYWRERRLLKAHWVL
jgi:hypothetical protein